MRILMLYSGQSIGIKKYTEQLIDTNTTIEYVKCYTGNDMRMSKYDTNALVNMYLNQMPDDIDGVHIQYDTRMFKGDGDEWDQLENFINYIQSLTHTNVYVTLHGVMFNDPGSFKPNRDNILYKCLRSYWLKTVIPELNKHVVIVHTHEHAEQLKTQGLHNPVVQLPRLPQHVQDQLPACSSEKLKVVINPGRYTDRECVYTACEVYKQLACDTSYELYMNVAIPVEMIDPELDDHIKFTNFDLECYDTYIEQLKQFDVAIITYKQDRAAPFSGVVWDCIGAGLVTLSTNSCYSYMCPVVEPWKLLRQLKRLTTSNVLRQYLIDNTYKHVYEHTKEHVKDMYYRIYNRTDDVLTLYNDENEHVDQDMLNTMTSTQFGRLLCKFVDMMGVSRHIYSRDKLLEFCDMSEIKYDCRYKALCDDMNLMHSFVCYLRTDQLVKKTLNITPPLVSDTAIIIPENRLLPHLEFHIRNAMLLLPGCTIKLVCTSDAVEKMRQFCDNIHANIHVIDTKIVKMTQNTYNDLLLSVKFWETFDEEYILIYQQDAILFRRGVEDFKQYDYVGAPWPSKNNDNKLGVGNGGFSLRNRNKMIKCLNTIAPVNLELEHTTETYMDSKGLWNPPEDVYYSKVMIDHGIGVVPDRAVASTFSQERVISDNPVGGHQYWLADEHVDACTRKNILIIDDKVPAKSSGQGLARAQEMIRALSDNFNVTLFPTNQTSDTCDERVELYKSMGVQMIIRLRDKHGDDVLSMLGTHVKNNTDMYDVILVSRPHNLEHIINHVHDLPVDKIVYDAEALFYERAFLKHQLTGEPSSEHCEQQKQQELNLLSITNKKIVVSQHEKDKITQETNCDADDIHVYGHAMNIMTDGKDFHEREGLFFLGAFVHDDTPNTDAVVYFVDEILPLVREQIDCKLYIGGYEPTKRVIDLGDENVKVLGFVDDPAMYYKSCKLFVSPHRVAAGIPWKISEAMANGLPVVGSSLMLDQMCVDETIMQGSNDPQGIANDIIDLYTNETKWTTTRNNAIEHILKTHDPDCLNNKLVKYLNEI